MKIIKAGSMTGEVNLSGDKSISHRAAIFSALAEGETVIDNFSTSEDCSATLNCLMELGVSIDRTGNRVVVKGAGKSGLHKPEKPLDCGNSGTTMRLLAGVLAGQNFESELIGDESLSKRPMERIAEPLRKMGAQIETADGRPPVRISGKNPLAAIDYSLPVASAQLKSAILLAGLNADGVTRIFDPPSKTGVSSSRNHSELMFDYLEAAIFEEIIKDENGFVYRVSIDGNSKLAAKNIDVPSDISSSAFFVVAGSVLPGSKIVLKNVGLNPTRAAFIDELNKIGARIEIENIRSLNNEKVADIRIDYSEELLTKEEPLIFDGELIANILDEIPVLAILGTQMKGGMEVRDAGELRVKESDRISAVVDNLKRMNAEIEEFEDGFRIARSDLKGAKIDSFGDHRIAMAFAVAALVAEGETEIINAECVNVSFPDFFEVIAKLTERNS
ncbi:MAG: 3-phosphoshikimate 1-carboxyvinyltransferase [Pyrinomonadaceae bacterium]